MTVLVNLLEDLVLNYSIFFLLLLTDPGVAPVLSLARYHSSRTSRSSGKSAGLPGGDVRHGGLEFSQFGD